MRFYLIVNFRIIEGFTRFLILSSYLIVNCKNFGGFTPLLILSSHKISQIIRKLVQNVHRYKKKKKLVM